MSARAFTLDEKRQGIITVFTNDKGLKSVDYRDTLVVTELDYETIKLNTNGWETATSKRVMNRYFNLKRLPLIVAQEKFTWYVYIAGEKYKYYDNMKINVITKTVKVESLSA